MKKKEKQRLFQAVRFFFLLMMMIFGVENDKAMYPASTIKAFVMASIYDQIQNKKIKNDTGDFQTAEKYDYHQRQRIV